MIYVLDTNIFIVLSHYFPEHFPSFWEKFDGLVFDGRIISVREVYKELDNKISKQHVRDWIEKNKSIFLPPNSDETEFVSKIFAIPHFQYLLQRKKWLASGPAADPFVIASAKIRKACVVTEEMKKENAAKIPNVCEHFGIKYTNLKGLMQHEKWQF